mmetsp:Transcript_35324/g.26335  ORF Transcript_35324/g.26335 Transcript_35324/m.26335 type:complete len:146 (+) Transcript_35324:208-645(+)
MTDYVLDIDFDANKGGWQAPVIKPLEELQIDPSNVTLHYSIECFEGLKAYITHDKSKVQMFRADKNCLRMLSSHAQLGLAPFDPNELLECMKELLRIEKDWIPLKPFHSMYIRPTSIAMDNRLGLGKVTKAKTFVLLSPVGPYFP